jgi:hypothetical protein
MDHGYSISIYYKLQSVTSYYFLGGANKQQTVSKRQYNTTTTNRAVAQRRSTSRPARHAQTQSAKRDAEQGKPAASK